MYQVYFDNYPIYDPRDEDLIVREPEVHLAVGAAGEMAFTIDPEHPYIGALSRIKGIIDLRADERSIFKGRILKGARDFQTSQRIEVEGLLACLNDSRVAPFSFPEDWVNDAAYQQALSGGNVIAFFLGWLLDQHNAQVKTGQRILLGDVTVTDPNNYIARAASDYPTTMECIRSALEDTLGGYLLVDYSGAVPVLNYYADLPYVNTQVVEFGENLLDLLDVLDATDTFTAVLPVGKDGLTIEGLEDGEISPGYFKQGRIIYSAEAEADYGARIIRKVDFPDVTLATNLRTKGLATLQESGGHQARTITVTAADLGTVKPEVCRAAAVAGEAIPGRCLVGTDRASATGQEGISRFIVGRYVEFNSAPHGFSTVFPLTELDPDILDPGNTRITLGHTMKAASDLARGTQMAAAARLAEHQLVLNNQQEAINAQQEAIAQQQAYAVQQAAEMDELPQIIQTEVTAAIQTSESIVYTALERYVETQNFDEFQQTVESQFSLMSDELVLRFTEATDQTKLVDGDLQRTLETLSKYFEFGQDGLKIRAGENAMELTLDNDMIIFTKNGQQFGWWDGQDFHTGNIKIGVTERAQFGSFAFIPRENGLSFLEVGD